MDRDGLPRLVAFVQGAYFAVTGLWPLVHMASFLTVTGPKTDLWLVQTVGVLVLAIGLALLVAARRRVSLETRVLAVGSALGLAAVDVVFSTNGTISGVYMLDALVEVVLVVAWVGVSVRPRTRAAPA